MKSESKRTEVTVKLDEDGSGLVLIERDGHNLHRFDIPKEQKPVDG